MNNGEAEERDFNRAFCARVKTARRASGKTQADIARALGISATTYRRYESGSGVPHHLMEDFAAVTGRCGVGALAIEHTRGSPRL
jgi:transcriptional regulator with XRE-family HTH domain